MINNMKTIWFAAFVVVSVILFTGCDPGVTVN